MTIKILKHLHKSSLMVEVSKYSIKPEAVIHMCTTKKLFWRVLKISQKKTFAWVSFQIKLQAYSLKLFLIKAPVQVFSCNFSQIFQSTFLTKHIRVTPSPKYLLFVTSTSATKCYHWPCFFRFTLNIFRVKTSLL